MDTIRGYLLCNCNKFVKRAQKAEFFTIFCVLVGAFFVLAGNAIGQPEIQNLGGDFSHGGSVTILGYGFGEKVPAAPLRYENFEDGTLGERLKTQENGGYFTFDSALSPSYSEEIQRIPGEICAFQDFSETGNQTIGLKNTLDFTVDVDTIYVSGWTYRHDYENTAQYCENAKIWINVYGHREYGDYPYTSEYPQARLDSYYATTHANFYSLNEDGMSVDSDSEFGEAKHFNEWFRMERYLEVGDPGVANGSTWMAYNGEIFAENSGMYHTTSKTFKEVFVSHYWRINPYDNPELPQAHIKIYWGELYMDNTQARVEIGDDVVFANCTHREIQIPHTWDSNQVGFTVNQGTFAGGENLFLFVIDENGNPSLGVPIVLDSNLIIDGPGIPSQPIVN